MASKKTQRWIVYTDGASRGNPGLAGGGAHIVDPDGNEYNYQKFFGEKTNNQAEYGALIVGLNRLVKLGAKHIIVRADSQLLVKQMQGAYKVKDEKMQRLFNKASELLQHFNSYKFEHVPREENKIADKLANKAIDEEAYHAAR